MPLNWHGKTPELAYVLEDCGAKAVVAHADLLPQLAPAMPPGVPLLVVPTPPEIAAAYGLADALCRPPPGARLWRSSQAVKPGTGDKVAKTRSRGSSLANASTTRLIRKSPKLIPARPRWQFEIE